MSLPTSDNPYTVLGVPRTATEAEIRRAYFTKVREHPPERDPEGFKQIRAAYERLRAGGDRAATDLFLIDTAGAPPDLGALRRPAAAPPSITPEVIAADLVALEAFLLLEELKG